MKRMLAAAAAVFVFGGLYPAAPVRAQSGTETEITFVQEEKEKTRQQLRRLLSEYDLDPWIFTQKVQIGNAEITPHSHPILTLSTRHLSNDVVQLSFFLHEQIHWFVGQSVPPRAPEDAEEAAVIRELRERYPDVPDQQHGGARSEYSTYLHLIVNWLEFDAMIELLGKEQARELTGNWRAYSWIYDRVLEDTQEIGAILAKHDLIITPEKGLAIDANGE